MAKKAFNLGDYLKSEGPVSTLDTEQIVRIPLDQIDPNPDNFYSLEGLEELAANIELVGLLDALRVRPASLEHVAREPARRDEGGRYVVVSGHRRRAACMMIRDGGNPMFDAGIPCIIEYGDASPAMRELRLIYANSATRVMSAADLSKQAERVTELLYQLKEQGVEFPGRMRDHVAQACQVSASKIARLHAIRGKLIDVYRLAFDAGKLNEGNAYRLSQESEKTQGDVFTRIGPTACDRTANELEAVIEQVKKPRAEPQAAPELYRSSFDAEAYLQERAEEDLAFYEMLEAEADNFLALMGAVLNRQDGIAGLKLTHGSSHHGWLTDWVDVTCSPKGVRLLDIEHRHGGEDITRTWTDVYDVLCTIALSRAAADLCAADPDEDEASVSRMDTAAEPAWQTGTPQRNGRYYCRIRFADSPEDGGRVHEQRGEWRDGGWWFFGEPEKYGIQVVGWWPLPDA